MHAPAGGSTRHQALTVSADSLARLEALCSEPAVPRLDSDEGMAMLLERIGGMLSAGVHRMSFTSILSGLSSDAGTPWSEQETGRQMTARRLSELLGRVGLRSAKWADGQATASGYVASDFRAACRRFVDRVIDLQRSR